MKEKVIIAWSGGKDSAFALYEIQRTQKYEIVALLTIVTSDYDRISAHGVRRDLLEQQADALGLPLEKVFVRKSVSNAEYEEVLLKSLENYLKQGVCRMVFGDVFLQDIRRYREEVIGKVGMKTFFPLWGRDTCELANSFIDAGFKATITVVDSNVLRKEFVGRDFDKQFLRDLPKEVDPCGENGEFHTFVYNGPIFEKHVVFGRGKTILIDKRFWHCDLIS